MVRVAEHVHKLAGSCVQKPAAREHSTAVRADRKREMTDRCTSQSPMEEKQAHDALRDQTGHLVWHLFQSTSASTIARTVLQLYVALTSCFSKLNGKRSLGRLDGR